MSNAAFTWLMRNAAKFLAVFAVLILIGAVWHGVAEFLQLQKQSHVGFVQPPIDNGMLVYVIASALGSASLPLFGAALLWRADCWLQARRVEPDNDKAFVGASE